MCSDNNCNHVKLALPKKKKGYRRQCLHAGCSKRPVFNLHGQTKGKFCVDHKLPGMIDVKNKVCDHDGCTKRPVFNLHGQTKGKLCSAHKLPGMINVIDKVCDHDGCTKRPVFNLHGQTKGKFCSAHKLTGMFDVIHKVCQHDGCTKIPSYGIPGHQASSCSEHKMDKMIRKPRSVCKHPKCREIALYGARIPTHCEDHKHNEEINLVERECIKCNLPNILDDNGVCGYCDPSKYHKFRLAKQREVKISLDVDETIPEYEYYDRIVDSACGLERPDFMWDCGTHFVVLEVDEHQHDSRKYQECECPRMINIAQGNGMPTVFLRYNPDEYKTIKGNVKTPTHAARMKELTRWLKHMFVTKPNGYCTVKQLYYHGWFETDTEIHVVQPFES